MRKSLNAAIKRALADPTVVDAIARLVAAELEPQPQPVPRRQSTDTVIPTPAGGWVYDDGGRKAAGFTGETPVGDCVPRAIAIATGKPYREVYDELHRRTKLWHDTSRSRAARESRARQRPSPRTGTYVEVYKPYIEDVLGWVWTPTKFIGDSTVVHLNADELPKGRLIAKCSKHLVAVVDGVIHDIYDPSREGERMVYGHWSAPS